MTTARERAREWAEETIRFRSHEPEYAELVKFLGHEPLDMMAAHKLLAMEQELTAERANLRLAHTALARKTEEAAEAMAILYMAALRDSHPYLQDGAREHVNKWMGK